MPNLNQYHDALGPTRQRLNTNRHKVFASPTALVCRSVFFKLFFIWEVAELEEELGADWCWLKTVERFAALSTHVRSAGGYMLWSRVTRNCGADMWIRHTEPTVILFTNVEYKREFVHYKFRSAVYKTSAGVEFSPLSNIKLILRQSMQP